MPLQRHAGDTAGRKGGIKHCSGGYQEGRYGRGDTRWARIDGKKLPAIRKKLKDRAVCRQTTTNREK